MAAGRNTVVPKRTPGNAPGPADRAGLLPPDGSARENPASPAELSTGAENARRAARIIPPRAGAGQAIHPADTAGAGGAEVPPRTGPRQPFIINNFSAPESV